jgi:hypothetical protein
MGHIFARELVHAPLASAEHLLAAFFAAHAVPQRAGARVVLAAAGVRKAAIVTLTAARRPADMTPRYAMRWEAEDSDAFPTFNGTLTIDADEDYNSFWLAVDGSYEPEAELEGRIASEMTRNLLIALRDAAEAEFKREERSKPGVQP